MNGKLSTNAKIAAIVFHVLAVIMLFGKWIEVDMLFYSGKYNIFEISNFFSGIGSFTGGDSDVEFFAAFIKIVAIAILVLSAISALLLLTESSAAPHLSRAAAAVTLFAVAAFIIFYLYACDELGMASGALGLTAMPFLTAAFNIVACVCASQRKKIDLTSPLFATGTMYCSRCGAQMPVNGQFCEKCGAKK